MSLLGAGTTAAGGSAAYRSSPIGPICEKTRRREPAGCLIYALRPSRRLASRGTELVRLVRPDRRYRIPRRLARGRGYPIGGSIADRGRLRR